MGAGPEIGGAPVLRLEARDLADEGPAFVAAEILPGRGAMLLQARLRLRSGEVVDALHAPDLEQAARELDGGAEDFVGNRAFAFGGALLAPYANRIRGRPLPGSREIETTIAGKTVRLPRNWGGKAPGAEQYAMHGLILDAPMEWDQPTPERVTARLSAGDFAGRWPSKTEMTVDWRLQGGAIALDVQVRNLGDEPLPFGLGWHPYFALPSGRRDQARLRLPSRLRVEVNNYDEVLPTGGLLEVAGSAYDFNDAAGRRLGELYLDDCFTDLRREDGVALVEVLDPAADLGLRIVSATPLVKAVQVFAPPQQGFVVVEPQFNLADPFGAEWPAGVDTGMATIPPGGSLTYDVRVQPFVLGNRPNT